MNKALWLVAPLVVSCVLVSTIALAAQDPRAGKARSQITSRFNIKQQAFLDFVLSHYVQVGVEELDQAN